MRTHRDMALKAIAILMLVSMLGVPLLVSGCGSSATATPAAQPTATKAAATGTTPTAVAATPTKAAKPGGVLVFGLASEVVASAGTFDPQVGGITGFMFAFDQCYENLFTRDPKTFAIVPQLAEKYELSADSTAITIYLRKGVKWHNVAPVNGREFTADDVKWNIERQKNASPGLSSTSYWKRVASIDVIDKYTVKLTLTAPYASITWLISDPNFVYIPREMQEQNGDKQMKVAIGTGPFMFKSYETKVALEFAKNPDYYQKGLPLLDGYKIVFITDPAAQQAAMRSGQVHVMNMQSATTKAAFESSVKGAQAVAHIGSPYILWMNNKVKPFDDVRVRKAVHLALDRRELIQLAEGGAGQLMTNYPSSTDAGRTAAELANVPGYRQPKDADIAEAKRLLAEAGYASGLVVQAMCSATVGNTLKANEIIQSQLKKIGIDWQIQNVETTVANAALFASSPTFQVLTAGVSVRPDMDKTNYYSTKSPTNVWGFGSAELDALWVQALAEGDATKRVALYRKADDVLLDLANTPPLYQGGQFALAVPELRGWETLSGAPAYWHGQAYKYAWFDK